MQLQDQVINAFRLSPQQKRVWYLQKNSQAYYVQADISITGNLYANILKSALELVIERQEILRTNFIKIPGIKTPVQKISTQGCLIWQEIDLSDRVSSQQAHQVASLREQEKLNCANLDSGSPLRSCLIRLSVNECILLITLPAIFADSYSIKNLVQEISQCYDTCLKVKFLTQDDEIIQYVQFSEWQNELLQDTEEGKEYWQKYDLSKLSRVSIPFENQSNGNQQFEVDCYEWKIDSDLLAQIETVVSKYKSSVSCFLLSCWQILLGRFIDDTSIIIGIAADGRKYEELKTVIGLMTKYLPISTNLEKTRSFSQLLSLVDQSVELAEEWEDYFTWENGVESLDSNTDNVYLPFCFDFQTGKTNYQAQEIRFFINKCFACNERFKINLSCYHQPNYLTATFHYDVNLFSTENVELLARYFQNLVRSAVNNPDKSIEQLEILNESDRQQLLAAFNHPQVDLSEIVANKCFHQLFAEQVLRTPNNIAVRCEEQKLTYAELNARSNQLAHYLQKMGVQAEVLVGIYMERSLNIMVALMAILKAGGAYVPLDPDLPVENLSLRLQDAQAQILLTQQDLATELALEAIQVVCLDQIQDAIASESEQSPHTDITIANLAYVIYTSGSTGQPKGVAVEHRQLLNYLDGIIERLNLPSAASFAMVSTLAADLGNTAIFPALSTGGCLHIISKERATDPEALIDYFSSHSIDCLKIVPSHLEAILTSVPSRSILPQQRLILGGEAASWNLIKKIQQLDPECTIINHYGPTEATVGVLTYQLQPDGYQYKSATVPLGRPIANTQTYLLDCYLQPVPIGVKGELYIGGAPVTRGYLHHPELTQIKFIPNPFSLNPQTRLYKTGDLARYLPDGNIEFLGRIDHQVKIRGYRIELEEIEAVLHQHPDIAQTVVIQREDTPGDQRLVAYVVAQSKRSLNHHTSELRSFLQGKLPEYILPSAFVLLKSLPLTANGKIDRQALPIPVVGELKQKFIAPRTAVEKVLAGIWAELLNLARVSVVDNFFELGGHSLLLTQLVVRVREAFQINLPLSMLFETPTVAGLAERIEIALKTGDVKAISSRIDLNAEAVLDPTILPKTPFIWSTAKPKAILLTGATGFLGSFLLAELLQKTQADIYCLVRAVNSETAKQKIYSCLTTYSLWQESFSSRIVPVVGELSQPLLGLTAAEFTTLASEIDIIYHNGAMVNFVYPYSVLKPTNVLGTQEILRLASQIKIKPVNFISTTNAISPNVGSGAKIVRESDVINPEEIIDTGYAQSKWVAEKLINAARDRGLPICIYRPGRIIWHSETGVGNVSDNTFRMLKGCIQLGSVPQGEEMINLIPVDFVTKAIVHLSQQKESLGKAFHLINLNPAPLNEIINWVRSCGYQLREIPGTEWREELRIIVSQSPDNALHPLVPFWSKEPDPDATSLTLQFDCENTLNSLKETNIKCPPVNKNLFDRFLSYLIQTGRLDAPHLDESNLEKSTGETDDN
ncbi:non-ribosomal peptide synthetase [Calothrix sp. PCC 6303]|uniref:non-ribosomal peptide synthetase family protein n=1 Tax=Calothrix sp. PCC 6303 TaxID=1170562 RepID=UPI0002A02A6D|nr:non-ribosomal peptide synthetase [Calothrix sp. PCC 6303]AFZ01585.1 amino acid adenylation domain protein [Calothrix sp. PCC 6303]